MAIIRGQSLLVGQSTAAISAKSGVILKVDIQMTGRTLRDATDPTSGFATSNMQFYAVDGVGKFPLGGNTNNPIIIPFLGVFFYGNTSENMFRLVDGLGYGSIKLTSSAALRDAGFEGNLTFACIPVDSARPHDLNVSWEIYEFE